MERRRKFWGWGFEDARPGSEELAPVRALVEARFGARTVEPMAPPRLDEIKLPPSRVAPTTALAGFVTREPFARASHAFGKSFRDVVRAFERQFGNPPDAVATPRTEAEVGEVLEWCQGHGYAAIPYGGGSSVVGGVEPPSRDAFPGTVSIDLGHLDRVLEIDRVSRAARIQGGVLGPALEDQLRAHHLTLRHFPQSFEFSSLGGWIATRAGGHYATRLTHIDDLVESVRVITPTGTIATRRLPASGAGPSPERLFIGSEGSLGVITEAWMRLQDRPRFRASTSIPFPGFLEGAAAVRALAQSGLEPSNCRLLDPGEAFLSGTGNGSEAVLVLGFESADHSLDPWMDRALELCAAHGGRVRPQGGRTRVDAEGASDDAVGSWRRAFLRMPYLRDEMVGLGMISETFETAITWDRFEHFHEHVVAATLEAVRSLCGVGEVTCRFTHAYPDGVAPYFTVIAPSRFGSQLQQWSEIKAAASEAILAAGGTITHHHAVGRDHRPWYDRERADGFARALGAVKRELDPTGILNPGVLIDRPPAQNL